ncbi:MAG: hypothetical protein K2O39_06350 [Clostridiales bacterium]|nr:hypothetical protein [Clostridiales bacterium]
MPSRYSLKKSIVSVFCALSIILFTFCLAACSYDDPFASYKRTSNTSDLLSRATVKYDNINGNTVTVDIYKRAPNEALNNPNVGQALLLQGCMRYKQKYPDAEVKITIASFHFSVVAAVCVDPQSRYYGYMKSLYDKDSDSNGFVRIAYQLVQAAKMGIEVTVIGQIDASPVTIVSGEKRNDLSFDKYFTAHLSDQADDGKTVGDYMNYRKSNWTSYGDKSASDMMHIKMCTVSGYIDDNGNEHGHSVWLGSTNLDGIDYQGYNGHNSVQTGIVISDHKQLWQVAYNYITLMSNYCGQEEISIFRDKMIKLNTEQIDLITEGKGDEISEDERIVYLGTESDKVFELYFTPIGGPMGVWDVKYNPYSKYLSKLLPAVSGGGSITFVWNNPKYRTNFEYSKTLTQVLQKAFTENARRTNRLYIHLPGFDTTVFDTLVQGKNIGVKKVNTNLGLNFHSKDFQLSYIEDFERRYVTVLNTLNMHQGAMSYQTNSLLVIKETVETGNNVYVEFGKLTADGTITDDDKI